MKLAKFSVERNVIGVGNNSTGNIILTYFSPMIHFYTPW